MVLASYVAFMPLAKLLAMMQEKGFLKPEDRPTIVRVIRVYVIRPIRVFIEDVRTKPFADVLAIYVRGALLHTYR